MYDLEQPQCKNIYLQLYKIFIYLNFCLFWATLRKVVYCISVVVKYQNRSSLSDK